MTKLFCGPQFGDPDLANRLRILLLDADFANHAKFVFSCRRELSTGSHLQQKDQDKTMWQSVHVAMGAIWWERRGTCPPTFLGGGDIICYVPPLFCGVSIWRGFKTKCYICHVLCEEFFMLDVTHNHFDVGTEFGVVSLILIFYKFLLQK